VSRLRTGTIKLHGDHYDARITLNDGSRPWIHLPAGLTEKQARAKATSLTETARKGGGVLASRGGGDAPSEETFEAWADRWCKAREERGLTSVKDDRGRLRKWVFPHLGSRPIVDIKRLDLERLVEELDASVRAELLS
jgi:hypothetical protein